MANGIRKLHRGPGLISIESRIREVGVMEEGVLYCFISRIPLPLETTKVTFDYYLKAIRSLEYFIEF